MSMAGLSARTMSAGPGFEPYHAESKYMTLLTAMLPNVSKANSTWEAR